MSRGVWSTEEHDRFLQALQLYPNGPWKAVAAYVHSRSVRQVQTHAQKYHEKIARRLRGLRKDRQRLQRPEHRIDDEMMEICEELTRERVPLSPRSFINSRDHYQELTDMSPRPEPRRTSSSSHSSSAIRKGNKRQKTRTSAYAESPADCSEPFTWSESASSEHPSFNECIDFLMEMLDSNDFESYACCTHNNNSSNSGNDSECSTP